MGLGSRNPASVALAETCLSRGQDSAEPRHVVCFAYNMGFCPFSRVWDTLVSVLSYTLTEYRRGIQFLEQIGETFFEVMLRGRVFQVFWASGFGGCGSVGGAGERWGGFHRYSW